MDAFVPYIFFIYMFIITWVLLLNYDEIKSFSSSDRISIGTISITIALFAFIGAAVLYHGETKKDEFKEKIKDICPESPFDFF